MPKTAKSDYKILYGQLPDKNLSKYRFASVDPGVKHCGVNIEDRELNEDGKVRIKTLYLDNVGFGNPIHEHVLRYLHSITNLLLEVDLFVIERQMYISRHVIIEIMSIIVTYMVNMAICQNMKICILEVNPKLKGKVLGHTGGNLKSWSVIKAHELLDIRGQSSSVIDQIKAKKDDPCDALLQIEALLIQLGYSKITTDNSVKYLIINAGGNRIFLSL